MPNIPDGDKMRVALAAWEIGRAPSGFGAKVGGLAVVVEELPPALVESGREQGLDVEVVTISPCFGSYDRSRLKRLPHTYSAIIDNDTQVFEVYEHRFDDGQRVLYFWNERWLGPLGRSQQFYPGDAVGLRTYAAVCQAMAGYLNGEPFDTLHMHDYHVGLIPFYLASEKAATLPFHLTIHNASYQGVYDSDDGAALLAAIHLDTGLYARYFQFFDSVNLMRAAMIRTHESAGKVTTVSGDLDGSWGYAKELREREGELMETVGKVHPGLRQQAGHEVRKRLYFPTQGLQEFQEVPVIGITNGIGDDNKGERLPWLQAATLRKEAAQFRHPEVQREMTSTDHNFCPGDLSEEQNNKHKLKRLLHLEAFEREPDPDAVLLVVIGRMVEQKGLHLVAEIIDRVCRRFPEARFLILGSAPAGDAAGRQAMRGFETAARLRPESVFLRQGFDLALSKLMLAGGDFSFIPSRFEPCGIVDYESVLLGTIVIGRLTGGLAKVRAFSFLYEWFDLADEQGEQDALFAKTAEALSVFRDDPNRILGMRRAGMAIDGSWQASAAEYLQMYRYGAVMQRWNLAIRQRAAEFADGCSPKELQLLRKFLSPGSGRQSNPLSTTLLDGLERR